VNKMTDQTTTPATTPAASGIQVLKKGGSIPVATKEGTPIKKVYLGMGWTIEKDGGDNFDLDFSLALAGADKKIKDVAHLIYYDNLQFKVGDEVVVQHSADNLTGSTGSNDDEWGTINLADVPADVQHIFGFVNMYDAVVRKQTFGDVTSAYFKMIDAETNKEFANYELEKEFATHTGVMIFDIHRVGQLWEVALLATPIDGSIEEILKSYPLE